ncbi:MAG: SpaA isopeptide-forming pilin-related protein, partial [Finegoldia magna]|nr:SpaA isopeptide-forming pilin-related protein [Finegoldia magna]
YEDSKGALQKEFFEIKTTKEGGKELVKSPGDFQNLLNRNTTNPETHVDKDETFYVINKSKPYFFNLYKGFMEEGKFKNITKGKLKVKIYADPADKKNTDTNVYEQTIDLSKNAPYSIDLNNNIQFGRDYLLEEVKSPDGYAKTKYRYKLRFAYDNSWDTPFVATLVAVLKEVKKEDGTKEWVPLTNKEGKNISDSGQYLGDGKSINSGFPFQIVNKKTEVVFTKKGKDKVKGEDGKLKDKETPLKDVEFYLEKQDPDDIQKENQGYYPLTKDMKYIKSEVGRDKLTHYYIEEEDGKKTWLTGPLGNEEVTPETHRGIYKSEKDGKFKITDLTDGYYRLIEPKAAKDANGEEYMKVNGPIKTFKVVDGKVKIYTYDKDTKKIKEAEVDAKSEATVTNIINEKPGKGEFTLTKEDEKGGKLEGVKFTLHKTDADETPIGDKVYKTGTDGKIKFTGLPYGYYWLKETKTKNGYILDTKKKLIALGGDKEWKVPEKPKDDVSKAIKFYGTQDQLVSTADSKRKDIVYPNKAEGIFAKFNFKIDEKTTIKPGDFFTIKFSDNVDLDGINKDYYDKGQKGDEYFNIIGPAGLLAKAKVNDDRRSITYTFTDYVKDYKPESMSMFLQLFPNRRKV